MGKESVAVYWDFENIHASLYDSANGSGAYGRTQNRSKQQEPLLDVQALYDFATTYGNVAINKAYCNWQWFAQYRHPLLKCAVELIQIFPPGASAKNGADIKLSLDVIEDVLRFPHISAIIVIGGDSDFIPLAQKIKAAGKDLIGIGCKSSTNQHWANSCSDFRYYETFVSDSQADEQAEEDESDTIQIKDPVELLSKAIKQITKKTGDEWVVKASIRPIVKRLDPTFDESNYECKTFAELLKKYPRSFKIKPGEHDHLVSLV
ncbi:MAG: NYN domain-containing protein [Desulfuromonadales bacterium]|nr:NYN domain-containing protein [Desulfuromonadales bacterium]